MESRIYSEKAAKCMRAATKIYYKLVGSGMTSQERLDLVQRVLTKAAKNFAESFWGNAEKAKERYVKAGVQTITQDNCLAVLVSLLTNTEGGTDKNSLKKSIIMMLLHECATTHTYDANDFNETQVADTIKLLSDKLETDHVFEADDVEYGFDHYIDGITAAKRIYTQLEKLSPEKAKEEVVRAISEAQIAFMFASGFGHEDKAKQRLTRAGLFSITESNYRDVLLAILADGEGGTGENSFKRFLFIALYRRFHQDMFYAVNNFDERKVADAITALRIRIKNQGNDFEADVVEYIFRFLENKILNRGKYSSEDKEAKKLTYGAFLLKRAVGDGRKAYEKAFQKSSFITRYTAHARNFFHEITNENYFSKLYDLFLEYKAATNTSLAGQIILKLFTHCVDEENQAKQERPDITLLMSDALKVKFMQDFASGELALQRLHSLISERASVRAAVKPIKKEIKENKEVIKKHSSRKM